MLWVPAVHADHSTARILATDFVTGVPVDRAIAELRRGAQVLVREAAVVCGRPWVEAVCARIDPSIQIEWAVAEGEAVVPDQRLFVLSGPARSLLTAERPALNFLQTLSAVASRLGVKLELVTFTSAGSLTNFSARSRIALRICSAWVWAR